MNIAYLPFTSLTEKFAAAAYRRFGRFSIYTPVKGQETQLVRTLADENRIDARCPISGEERLVMDLCRSLRNWGAVHQGQSAGLKRFAESGFYNNQFAAEVRSEILKGGGDLSGQQPDPIRNARVFLQMAQEFDLQEADIEIQLAAADKASKQLFDELKGEGYDTAEDASSSAGIPDAGAFMAESRMTAWCLLAGMDAITPDAFLTRSRAIVDLLSGRFSSLVHVGEFSSVFDAEANRDGIAERLCRLSRASWEGPEVMRAEFDIPANAARDGFQTDIYLLPDLSPGALIWSFIDHPSGSALSATDVRHSFICLMSPRK